MAFKILQKTEEQFTVLSGILTVVIANAKINFTEKDQPHRIFPENFLFKVGAQNDAEKITVKDNYSSF